MCPSSPILAQSSFAASRPSDYSGSMEQRAEYLASLRPLSTWGTAIFRPLPRLHTSRSAGIRVTREPRPFNRTDSGRTNYFETILDKYHLGAPCVADATLGR